MSLPELHPELAMLLAEFFHPQPRPGRNAGQLIAGFRERQLPEVSRAAGQAAYEVLRSEDEFGFFQEVLDDLDVDLPSAWGLTPHEWLELVTSQLGHEGWLSVVLTQAQESEWCLRHSCTTCGAMEFRRAYWSGARDDVGATVEIESARRPGDLLRHASPEDREAMVKSLVSALSALDVSEAESEGVGTILLDLDPPFLRYGVSVSLAEALGGTPVGMRLAAMRAHAAAVRAEREARAAFESAEAVESRRKEKRRATRAKVEEREREKAAMDAERVALLADLRGLDPADRITRFAHDEDLNLDSVPEDLIPTQGIATAQLDAAAVRRLLDRIGRRRGAWGRLRRWLLDGPPG